ncbi:unnamed protein product [Caenorhabditis brenneri]
MTKLIALLPIICVAMVASKAIDDSKDSMISEDIQKLAYQIEATKLTAPTKIRIAQGLEDIKAAPGEHITLHCMVLSTPSSVFHWEHNGIRVQEDSNVNIHERMMNIGKEVVGDGTISSFYTIPCVNANSTGIYKCIAFNGHGTVESSAKVIVEGKSTECVSNDKTAPKIITITGIRLQENGRVATLNCRADKPAKFEWTFKGKPIDMNDGRFSVLSYGDLVISNISWSDMGDFTCYARNKYGEDHAEAMLFPTKPN